MDYIINERPCLLLEAAELVYALVNRIPAEQLTSTLPYTIPVSEVIKIQNEVCQELDPEDEELKFYFKGISVDDRYGRLSCLACCLLYANAPIAHYHGEDAIAALRRSEISRLRPFHVLGIGPFSISFSGVDQYTNLTQEFSKLAVPQYYQMQLVEAFSAFDWHIERLGQLLCPLAERLGPLLKPWVERAAPLRDDWARFLDTEAAVPFMLRKSSISDQNLKRVELTMRYFSPLAAPGEFQAQSDALLLHMGVARTPGQDTPKEGMPLEVWEYTALKLLSSPDRIAILGAVVKRPKSIQDLALELNLNPGSVFRDLNNLYNVGLLSQQVIGGRNYYTANLHQIEKITNHLVTYLNQTVEME